MSERWSLHEPDRNRPSRPLRKHLQSLGTAARGSDTSAEVDLTRHHGQGNGLRIHGILFAVVSLVTFLVLIAGIPIVNAMM